MTVLGLRTEHGSTTVLFALLLPALVLVLALAVDIGNWFVHHRHLQMQADAAALAGGDAFGDCFSPDTAVLANANTTIEANATAYAGNAASTYNFQVGGGVPRVITLFNSKTFAVGGPAADDTETQAPCQTPHLMFDVKQTERDVPYIFAPLIDWVVPGSSTVVPAINARARVQLKTSTILAGSLPLAVPDVNPRYVTATFVDEASGAMIGSPVQLTKGAAASGLRYWSASAAVTLPADTKVGVRIGLGGQPATCAPANGIGGNGYTCYDYANSAIGLVAVRSVGTGGTVTAPKPRVWATTTCNGSPFFSEYDVVSPATACSVFVQAVMQSTAPIDRTKVLLFNAILDGGALKSVSKPLTWNGTNWSTGAYAVPVANGPVDVTLEWRYQGGSKQTYTKVQRVYSAIEGDAAADSGPIKELALSTPTSTLGAPYTLSAGTHTLTVSVGVEGSLDLSRTAETTMLRLTGGSRSSAVACDGPGASVFRDSIVNGCTTPYQINVAGYCPDPSPPPGPATCVPTETGEMAGPTLQAFDARYSSCPANNWPDYEDDDPRIVKLMITDFSALDGSGSTDVPVTNFAAFYVTGWTDSKCATNDPPPQTVKKGAIWGHFIKYVAPDPKSGGTEVCDPLAITPCVPVLVK